MYRALQSLQKNGSRCDEVLPQFRLPRLSRRRNESPPRPALRVAPVAAPPARKRSSAPQAAPQGCAKSFANPSRTRHRVLVTGPLPAPREPPYKFQPRWPQLPRDFSSSDQTNKKQERGVAASVSLSEEDDLADLRTLSQRKAAAAIGISPRTLARLTARGEGPPCLHLGFKRLRRYPVAMLRRYLALEIKNVLNPNEPKRKESA